MFVNQIFAIYKSYIKRHMIKIYKTKSKMKNSEVVENSCKELIFLGFERKGEVEIIHYVTSSFN